MYHFLQISVLLLLSRYTTFIHYFLDIYSVRPSIFPLNHPYHLVSSLLGSWFPNTFHIVCNLIDHYALDIYFSSNTSVINNIKCLMYKIRISVCSWIKTRWDSNVLNIETKIDPILYVLKFSPTLYFLLNYNTLMINAAETHFRFQTRDPYD